MRKYYIFILLLFLILPLFSCSFRHIEDTNGDEDFSLCSLTEYDIIHGSSSFYQGSVTRTKNNKTTITTKLMSGVSNLKTINPKGKTITIYTNFIANSGNARLVLLQGKQIIYDFKINEEDKYVISLSNEKYNLRLAGESLNFKLEYWVE